MSYEILSKLGGGSFGQVYRLRVPSGNDYALKLIAFSGLTDFIQARDEAKLMMRLSHPYIVQCGQCEFIGDNLVCLVLEYCGRGNLTNAIVSVVPEPKALLWFAQMADAIKYLHGENIMHRDIKPDNIFLDQFDNIKVGDLGIAREQEFTAQSGGTVAGTPCYMSPQILQRQRYNEKTDIWSLGCVFHQILSRAPPFSFENPTAVIDGPTPKLPGNYSADTRGLVIAVLDRNQDSRPSADFIFQSVLRLLANRGQRYQRHAYSPIGRLDLDASAVREALDRYARSARVTLNDDAIGKAVKTYLNENNASCCTIM